MFEASWYSCLSRFPQKKNKKKLKWTDISDLKVHFRLAESEAIHKKLYYKGQSETDLAKFQKNMTSHS